MSRVVLIGFMASGKSTVGRALADLLDWDFLDFDDEIERRTGLTIPEIFEEEGEDVFRAMEAELTEEVAERDHIVLSPGGGWITQPGLLDRLGPDTLSVWLEISPEEAVRRSRKTEAHRPLLAGPDPLKKAQVLIRERRQFYRLADAALPVDGRDPEELAWEIVDILRGKGLD